MKFNFKLLLPIAAFVVFSTNFAFAVLPSDICHEVPTPTFCLGPTPTPITIPTPPPESDSTKPIISITGDNPLEMFAGEIYKDPGFSASDNVDGDITSKVQLFGGGSEPQYVDFTVTYIVFDKAKNEGTTKRDVKIVKKNVIVKFDDFIDMKVGDKAQAITYNLSSKVTLNSKVLDEGICEIGDKDTDGLYVVPLHIGKCEIEFYSEEDREYKAFSQTISFNITAGTKKDVKVSYEDLQDMVLGDKPQELGYSVRTETEIDVKIVDTELCGRADKTGYWISALSEGTCSIEFSFPGNANFNPYKETKSFKITSPVKKDIEISSMLFDMSFSDFAQEITYETEAEILPEIVSVTPDICSVEYIDDGESFYAFPKAFGKCTVKFTFEGNKFYNELKGYETSFNVVKNIEDMSLNDGDMNNDGISDSKQTNVLTISGEDSSFNSVSAPDSKTSAIYDFRVDKKAVTTDGDNTILNICRNTRDGKYSRLIPKCEESKVVLPTQTKIDAVISFSMNGITTGTTQNIVINIQLDGDSTTIDPRKKVGDELLPIDGVDIKYITMSGKRVAQLSFQVTDGGKYDEDGVANGQIIDPVVLVSAIPAPTTTSSGGGIILPPLNVGYDAHIFVNTPVAKTTTGTVLGASTTAIDLSYGSRGEAVRALQQILIDGGYLKLRSKKPTGWFGPLTQAALKEWQAKNEVKVTGIYDADTRAKMNK